jgi:Uri superfamily endonuclease
VKNLAEKLHLTKDHAGSYVLAIPLKKPCRVQAGKLPEREFREGIYLYIGRAKKNLRGRLFRHMRAEKKLFWHIDYFLRYAPIKKIWCRLDFFSECQIASDIIGAYKEDCFPIPGFGSSDCRCSSHLIHCYGANSLLSSRLRQIHLKEVKIDEIE